jgi:putative transposase
MGVLFCFFADGQATYNANVHQPGKPAQNAYIERFNRTAREELLSLDLFGSIEKAQYLATDWLWSYNNQRPNTAVGGVPPRALL